VMKFRTTSILWVYSYLPHLSLIGDRGVCAGAPQISIFGEIWSFSLLLLSQPAKRVKINVQHQFSAHVAIDVACCVVFTARCYASAVLAMGLCLSVPVCLSVCHKSEFY